MKMQYKLLCSFALIVMLIVFVAVFNSYMMAQISEEYNLMQSELNKEQLLVMESSWAFATCRRDYLSIFTLGPLDAENMTDGYENFTRNLDTAILRLEQCLAIIEDGQLLSPVLKQAKEEALHELIRLLAVDYRGSGDQLYDAVQKNAMDLAYDIGMDGTDIAESIYERINAYILDGENAFEIVDQNVAAVKAVSFAVTGFAVVLASVLSFVLAGYLKRPIAALSAAVNRIARGDLSVDIRSTGKDEIGGLANDIAQVSHMFRALIGELNQVAEDFRDGDIDARVKEEKFIGDYKKAAIAINDTFRQMNADTLGIIGTVEQYGLGNFTCPINRYPGKKAVWHEAVDQVQENLTALNNEINYLINAVIAGKLNVEISSEGYSGGWKILIEGLNRLVSAVKEPVEDVLIALHQMAEANLNHVIESRYEGYFEVMRGDVNNTVAETRKYIEDISDLLSKMAEQNLDLSIPMEYKGDFKKIKIALEKIIDEFNTILKDFHQSAHQVAVSADDVSQASEILSRGVNKQVAAIEDIRGITVELMASIEKNTGNAQHARDLTEKIEQMSRIGNERMLDMRKAMDTIVTTSGNISAVIHVISNIAYQINILATNAVIEASRAGAKGKGFAVVADEVKDLADKSRRAVDETGQLLENTLNAISSGAAAVNETAESFLSIVTDIVDIAEINRDILDYSQKQQFTITAIEDGLTKIHDVAAESSQTSEEVALTAQELTVQSNAFKKSIEKFSLKV